MTKLSDETIKYKVSYWCFDKIIDDLTDAEIPYKMGIESFETVIFEVNKSDISKVDELLVKYD